MWEDEVSWKKGENEGEEEGIEKEEEEASGVSSFLFPLSSFFPGWQSGPHHTYDQFVIRKKEEEKKKVPFIQKNIKDISFFAPSFAGKRVQRQGPNFNLEKEEKEEEE